MRSRAVFVSLFGLAFLLSGPVFEISASPDGNTQEISADSTMSSAAASSDTSMTSTAHEEMQETPAPVMDLSFTSLWRQIQNTSIDYFPRALGALVVLILGWLLAVFVGWLARSIMRRTKLDERLSRWTAGEDAETKMVITGGIAKGLFYVIMLFVVVAVLQTLELTILTDPINQLLGKVFTYVPNLIGAAVLFVSAWIIASIIRFAVTRVMHAMKLDERFTSETQRELPNGFSLSKTSGNIMYWVTFLMFLPAILGTLGMEGMILPVQDLLDTMLDAIPNVLAAILIFVVGWLVARIVSKFVLNVLEALGADRATEQTGLKPPLGDRSISQIISTIVYALIIIPVAIAALDALRIEAISQPAIGMLATVLQAAPSILAALFLLIVAYVVARLLQGLASNLLSAVGFNRLPVWLGMSDEPMEGDRSPSNVGGYIVVVAIMLFALVEALELLGFGLLAGLMTSVIAFAGNILVGLVIFAIGLYLANLAHRLIRGNGSSRASLYAQVARIAIIIFVSAMALREMGIAEDIINMTFGIVLGSIAIAVAVAFGVGSRDIAGKQVAAWLKNLSGPGK